MAWSWRFPWYGKTHELSKLFYDEFKLCKVKEGSKVAFVTDPKNDPSYADACFTALYSLGADFFEAVVPYTKVGMGPTGGLLEALKKMDLVIDVGSTPWDKTAGNGEIRKAGVRVLLIMSPEDTLRALFATPELMRRDAVGEKMIDAAKTLRVTTPSGTDLTCDKTGREGRSQDGVADKPGEWDNMGSGTVSCRPLEDGANGTLVINPGEPYFASGSNAVERIATSQVKFTVKDGRIKKIDGGLDASILKDWFASWKDDQAYGISHIGYGTHPGARWIANSIMEWESYYGGMLVAFGRNFPGGKNTAPVGAHMDIAIKYIDWYQDDELIIKNGKFVHPKLR